MEHCKKLLLANKAWAREKVERDPNFFNNMSKDQKPGYLWIGCSDSRVPAEEITGASPGEIFVHRNIANMVIHSDLNAHSVIQYAVETLKVKNIIVCGHYGCGGVRAALERTNYGLLNKWLYNIKDTYMRNQKDLEVLSGEERVNRMVELSVCEQVKILSRMYLMQRSWKMGHGPNIHGWVFNLKDGLIRELITMDASSPHVDEVFKFPDVQ